MGKNPTRVFDEPVWYQPRTLIKGCTTLGTSHLPQVLNAFSTGTQVFDHLPKCRHFYAHRNEETAQKVLNLGFRSYSINNKAHPSEVLAARAYGRPQSLILDYADDLRDVMQLLCA